MPPHDAEALLFRKGATLTIDQEEFRRVLGHFASGVTIVTTHSHGSNYGITVSSFTSLSLAPRLVLICIDHQVVSLQAIRSAGFFAVNVLGEDGEHLSRRFSSHEVDKFSGVAFRIGLTGAPLLDDALAILECAVVQEVEGGDHTIFMGEVRAMATGAGKPLLYYRSGYHQLA